MAPFNGSIISSSSSSSETNINFKQAVSTLEKPPHNTKMETFLLQMQQQQRHLPTPYMEYQRDSTGTKLQNKRSQLIHHLDEMKREHNIFHPFRPEILFILERYKKQLLKQEEAQRWAKFFGVFYEKMRHQRKAFKHQLPADTTAITGPPAKRQMFTAGNASAGTVDEDACEEPYDEYMSKMNDLSLVESINRRLKSGNIFNISEI